MNNNIMKALFIIPCLLGLSFFSYAQNYSVNQNQQNVTINFISPISNSSNSYEKTLNGVRLSEDIGGVEFRIQNDMKTSYLMENGGATPIQVVYTLVYFTNYNPCTVKVLFELNRSDYIPRNLYGAKPAGVYSVVIPANSTRKVPIVDHCDRVNGDEYYSIGSTITRKL